MNSNDFASLKIASESFFNFIFNVKLSGLLRYSKVLKFIYTGVCIHFLDPFWIGNLYKNI